MSLSCTPICRAFFGQLHATVLVLCTQLPSGKPTSYRSYSCDRLCMGASVCLTAVGLIYDLRQKKKMEQKLPKRVKASQGGGMDDGMPTKTLSRKSRPSWIAFTRTFSKVLKGAARKERAVKYFWLNTADHSDHQSWLQPLLADVITVEKSLDAWFRSKFLRPPPVNHFHFSEVKYAHF